MPELRTTPFGNKFRPLTQEMVQGNEASSEIRKYRATQLREAVERLEIEINHIADAMDMLRRQYLELAELHQFAYIDPLSKTVVPTADKVGMDNAKLYHLSAVAALLLGTIVAATLTLLSLNGSRLLLFVGGAGFSVFIGVSIYAWMQATANADPRNPQAMRIIRRWVWIFADTMLVSLLVFGAMRFADIAVQYFVASVISAFEIGIFGLTAAFECARRINSWSGELEIAFKRLQARKDALAIEHASKHVELKDLQYRIEQANLEKALEEAQGQTRKTRDGEKL